MCKDGKEKESQSAKGSGAAVERQGRQCGCRIWKSEHDIIYALCRENSRFEYN